MKPGCGRVEDWRAATHAAGHRVALCAAWAEHQAEPDVYGHPDEPCPSDVPFCGCPTCIIRETLAAAWPHIKSATLAERAANACLN